MADYYTLSDLKKQSDDKSYYSLTDLQSMQKPAEDRGGVLQGAGNLGAGLVRGAGSIGATLVAPWDMMSDAIAGKGLSLESNRQRRADMDSALEGQQGVGRQREVLRRRWQSAYLMW